MYKASLGSSIKTTTFVFVALFFVIGVVLMGSFIVGLFEEPFDRKSIMAPIATFGLFGILYWVFSGRILGYEILNEGVKIVKGNNSDVIKKDTILEIKPITYKEIRFSIRTFGNGGIFSLSGSFTNKKFGDMTWYITRKDTLLMIVTKKEKFVISPDAPKDFIKEVEKLLNENPA